MKKELPLRITVEDGELIIRVGIARLDGHEDHPEIPYLPITDHEEWAKDIAYELKRDRGDGATPISLCFDEAIKSALELGSEAINYPRMAKTKMRQCTTKPKASIGYVKNPFRYERGVQHIVNVLREGAGEEPKGRDAVDELMAQSADYIEYLERNVKQPE